MRNIVDKIKRYLYSPLKYALSNGVKIGEGCMIADRDTFPTEGYLIEIGDYCQLTLGSRIFTHGGAQVVRKFYPDFDIFGKVKIGNYVYVGANALIMPGVTIGDNVLISAGSVVTKSIPSNVVVGGNPAHIICTVDEYIQRNLKYNTGTKSLGAKAKRHTLQEVDENTFIKKEYLK